MSVINFDTFFKNMEESKIQIISSETTSLAVIPRLLDNEALFQLPFLSLIILLMAKDKRKPNVSEIGQLVGECLEASMLGFKGSAQHLGWSANLRIRTVKAMTFLEQTQLISVQNRKGKLEITELGKKVISRALSSEDNLYYNLTIIARAYRNICISKQLDLELV